MSAACRATGEGGVAGGGVEEAGGGETGESRMWKIVYPISSLISNAPLTN